MMAARFARRNRGQGHSYTLDGAPVPGVTTVLGVMAKPALINWAARMAADYALDRWDELAELPTSKRHAAIAGAHRDRNKDARNRGTRIHTFGALLAAGTAVDVPEDLAGPVNAYARFLDTWDMQPVLTESPCVHTTYGYGGTFDAVVTTPKLGGDVLLDIKTGGVFPEAALQLAAYRHATHYLGADGELAAMPVTEGAYVARVHPDDVELVPVTADDETFSAFLYLLAVYRWQSAMAADVIGSTLYPEDRIAV
jgi:hypothetical protein